MTQALSPLTRTFAAEHMPFGRRLRSPRGARVPLIVDAGVGTASDACVAMEMGCSGVLMNTAIAAAKNPLLMAHAMKNAVIAGRQAYFAGRMPRREMASPSSPVEGIIPAKMSS